MGAKKKLFIIFILLALVAIVIGSFLTQEEKYGFDDGALSLQEIWVNNGILFNEALDAESLFAADAETLARIETEFDAKKKEFAEKNFADAEALNALADIYTAALALASFQEAEDSKQKNVSALNAGEYCSKIALFEERNSAEEKKLGVLRQLKSLIDSFSVTYPGKMYAVGLGMSAAEQQSLEAQLLGHKTATAAIREAC